MKKLAVFDIEILPNVFICCVKIIGEDGIIVFEMSHRVFQYKELIEFFTSGEYVFVGYNCSHYDTPIINMLIMHQQEFIMNRRNYLEIIDECKNLSDIIIDRNSDYNRWSKYKFANYFPQIDLMTMLASKALRVGLKPLQVSMCYPNVEEMIIDWNSWMPDNQIDTLIGYCRNDVGSTAYLLKLLKDQLILRQNIENEFSIRCLSKDGVGIGVDIFTKYVCDYLGITNPKHLFHYRENLDKIYVKDYIAPVIKFKTKPLQDVLEWYQKMLLDADGLKDGRSPTGSVIINKLEHSYGIGGLHSVNGPSLHIANNKFIYRDKDVTSFYPSLAEKYRFGPKGFLDAFLYVLTYLKESRVVAKRNGDKTKDQTYKLALNSILGHLRNMYGPYYAPEANVGICVNGQLMLLMLIEECELNGIECVSSNTDGATFKIPVEKEALFEEICSNWEKDTQMNLEAVDYEMIVMLAVNDYIAFKKGYSEVKDKLSYPLPENSIEANFTFPLKEEQSLIKLRNEYVKEKGFFITYPRIGKGLESLIVPKAIQNYFGKGIPVNETIQQFESIHDYLIYQKVDRSFKVEYDGNDVQHINRYYVSRGAPGLLKYKVDHGKKKVTNLLKGYGVKIANNLKEHPEFNIDYRYYASKANEIIDKIEITKRQLTLF